MTAKPAIIFDLDGTILSRRMFDWFRMYATSSSDIGMPFSEAPEVLKRLGKTFQLIALTARAELCKPNTSEWLNGLGLKEYRLFHSPILQLYEGSRARYKASVIEKLKSQGLQVKYGVGDRGSDFVAYVKNNVFPIVVLRPRQARRLKKIKAYASSKGLKDADWAYFFEESKSPSWLKIEEFIAARECGRLDDRK